MKTGWAAAAVEAAARAGQDFLIYLTCSSRLWFVSFSMERVFEREIQIPLINVIMRKANS